MDARDHSAGNNTSQIIVFGFFGTFLFGFAGLVIAYAIAAQQFSSNYGVNNGEQKLSSQSEKTVDLRRELTSVRPINSTANPSSGNAP